MCPDDISILNSLQDKDIVIYLYFKVLQIKIRDIAQLRQLSRGAVFYSIQKTRQLVLNDKIISAIQEMFVNVDRENNVVKLKHRDITHPNLVKSL